MHLLEDIVTVLFRNKLAQIGIPTDILVSSGKLVINLLLTTIIFLTTVFLRLENLLRGQILAYSHHGCQDAFDLLISHLTIH